MEICSKCGHKNKDSDHYCEKCGASIAPGFAGSKPGVHMSPIPNEEATIGWNYPLGEISFLNQNEAVKIFRLQKVQLRREIGKVVLSAKGKQIQAILGLGAGLTAIILHQIWSTSRTPGLLHIPLTGIAIAFLGYLFIWALLLMTAYRMPSVVFDCQNQTVEFLTGKRSKVKVTRKEIDDFLTRVVQRTDSMSRTSASWTAWSLYLKLKNGQELPIVELDTEAESSSVHQEITKLFFTK
jgi:hypothetical protein